jgi:hypothetical protein
MNAHTHERNVAGLDALRKAYYNLKKAARKEGVSFQSWCELHEQGTFLPDESTAPGPGEDAKDASESENSDDDDHMPEPVSPITAPSPKRWTGTRTKQDCRMRAGVARVIKGPENKPAEEGEEPILPGRRAGRIGKKVIVSSEDSEEVPLQVNRGKGRPEKAGKPLPFTAMLVLGNPKNPLRLRSGPRGGDSPAWMPGQRGRATAVGRSFAQCRRTRGSLFSRIGGPGHETGRKAASATSGEGEKGEGEGEGEARKRFGERNPMAQRLSAARSYACRGHGWRKYYRPPS